MYGMVNEGVREFITKHHGEDAWLSICKAAGIPDTSFNRLSSYDDEITYRLVGAICDFTKLSAEEALEAYGAYFIGYAQRSAMGNLLSLAGNTFFEKLSNLDDMHERMESTMPHLRPPSFEVEEVAEGQLRVEYYSEREGLAPMVIGLLHGLAATTGNRISVRHVQARESQDDADIFDIQILE